MATRDTPWPAGTPCWLDVSLPDVERGAAFYAAVLGWEVVDPGPGSGGYRIAQVDGRAAAGIGPVVGGAPPAWTLYFATDDADATAARVVAHGGTLLLAPGDVGGNGRMAVAADPSGAVIGLWQAGEMIGAGVVNEPGGLVWEEGRLSDLDTALAFYSGVFGFTYEPGEGGGQRTFHTGGEALGSIGAAPAGRPSRWLAYVSVESVGAAVEAARSRGGEVAEGPEPTPWGARAVVRDPFGAEIGLFGGA